MQVVGNIDGKWFLDYAGKGQFELRPHIENSTVKDDILYKLLEGEIYLKDNHELYFYIDDFCTELNIGIHHWKEGKIVHEFLSFDIDQVLTDFIQRELFREEDISHFRLEYSFNNRRFYSLNFADNFAYDFNIEDVIETE